MSTTTRTIVRTADGSDVVNGGQGWNEYQGSHKTDGSHAEAFTRFDEPDSPHLNDCHDPVSHCRTGSSSTDDGTLVEGHDGTEESQAHPDTGRSGVTFTFEAYRQVARPLTGPLRPGWAADIDPHQDSLIDSLIAGKATGTSQQSPDQTKSDRPEATVSSKGSEKSGTGISAKGKLAYNDSMNDFVLGAKEHSTND